MIPGSELRVDNQIENTVTLSTSASSPSLLCTCLDFTSNCHTKRAIDWEIPPVRNRLHCCLVLNVALMSCDYRLRKFKDNSQFVLAVGKYIVPSLSSSSSLVISHCIFVSIHCSQYLRLQQAISCLRSTQRYSNPVSAGMVKAQQRFFSFFSPPPFFLSILVQVL